MSDLFVYYARPAGIAPGDLVAALGEHGIQVEWRPTRSDQPDVLEGRLIPPGEPDADSQVGVYEQEIFAYQREELLDDLPPDSPPGQREALEAADAVARLTPQAGSEFDAVRAAALAAMVVAGASTGLIKREDESRVHSPAEYAEIEPLARDAGAPPGTGP